MLVTSVHRSATPTLTRDLLMSSYWRPTAPFHSERVPVAPSSRVATPCSKFQATPCSKFLEASRRRLQKDRFRGAALAIIGGPADANVRSQGVSPNARRVSAGARLTSIAPLPRRLLSPPLPHPRFLLPATEVRCLPRKCPPRHLRLSFRR